MPMPKLIVGTSNLATTHDRREDATVASVGDVGGNQHRDRVTNGRDVTNLERGDQRTRGWREVELRRVARTRLQDDHAISVTV